MSWLSLYRPSDKIKDGYFKDENTEYRFPVMPPKSYSECPKFQVPREHKKLTEDDQYNYFKELLNGGMRVMDLNGRYPDEKDCIFSNTDHSERCAHCDYIIRDWFWLCQVCGKKMCERCEPEKTEEIALADGAKKWLERKDSLLTCFEHHKENPFQRRQVIQRVTCNLCKQPDTHLFGVWHMSRFLNKDICPNCVDTPEGQELRSDSAKWITHEVKSVVDDFGSLLDWVPILQSVYGYAGPAVLVNLNPESEHHNRVCLMAEDGHGRLGYYIYPYDLAETIQRLDQPDDECYTRIETLMLQEGYEVYYG